MFTRAQFLRIIGTSASGLLIKPDRLNTFVRGNEFSKKLFGSNFVWGVATGAYQIEGAWDTDGKGPSVWDVFSHKNGKIHDRANGDISCNFYHKYTDDLLLLKKLNFKAFRFSVS